MGAATYNNTQHINSILRYPINMASSSRSESEEASFTTMDEKDPTLIGAHCQYTYCNQLDFLPFRCESCRGTFCLDHRSESGHHCQNGGERTYLHPPSAQADPWPKLRSLVPHQPAKQ